MVPELASYLERIEDLRSQVGRLIADLPAEALNWRPLATANSLAVLAVHIAGAEHFWIGEVVGGLPATRDRDAEFAIQAKTAEELVRQLDDTATETHQLLAILPPAELDGERQARGRTIPVRWCLLHVIDHTALHLGHMQLTYQLWTGRESKPSPFWFERLSTKER